MKYLIILLAALGFAPLVHAQGFNLGSALQAAQNMAATQGQTGTTNVATSPLAQQAQTAMVQQALQVMAANPQLVTQLAGSLNPQQQATLMQQALGLATQTFTAKEQASFTAFAATPEGQGIMAKLPQLMQQLTPVLLSMYAGQGAAAVAPAAGN